MMNKIIFFIMLFFLYIFLHSPIAYVTYVSFQENSIFPFPPTFTLEYYYNLMGLSDFHSALLNSLFIGLGSGVISTVLSTAAAVGILKFSNRYKLIAFIVLVSPLFIAHILIGISSLIFNRSVLGLSGNIFSAIISNSTYATAFAFLVVITQLSKYDWRLDEAASVFGANGRQTFMYVTFPLIWPAIFGSFVVAFLLSFNNLEISFYNLGATPTLPTLAWGSLRHGISQELYALTSLINGGIFLCLVVLYILLKMEVLKLDYRD